MKLERNISHDVLVELDKARAKFAPFNSAHEGFAVLKEEVDELWDEVKHNPGSSPQAQHDRIERMRREAEQIAAMAMRFIIDVCEEK